MDDDDETNANGENQEKEEEISAETLAQITFPDDPSYGELLAKGDPGAGIALLVVAAIVGSGFLALRETLGKAFAGMAVGPNSYEWLQFVVFIGLSLVVSYVVLSVVY
ncbi:MAG: hypothetical protein ACFB00_06865 [Parvularculaceae bacterium]